MTETLRLLAVLAHPDDESLGTGGVLARYAAEGVETYLVTATRGERGWWGPPDEYPGLAGLGQIREAELLAAAKVLGLREVKFLDYIDGDLDQADPREAIARIVAHVRRLRPHVILTFDPAGAYGHPDHIAISQFATAAAVTAADPAYLPESGPPHRASKFYYQVGSRTFLETYQAALGDLVMQIDGVERRAYGWEPWAVTTQIDTSAHWRTAWQAVACHRSQLPGYSNLAALPEAQHEALWGCQNFYRVFSTVNGGRAPERDLFAGLR